MKLAVEQIEQMANEFIQRNDDADPFISMKETVMSVRRNPALTEASQKAGALNEFMAWVLTNKDLSQKAKTTKFKELARKVVEAIKTLLWGKKTYRHDKMDNMFEALRFHTNVVARTTPTASETFNETTLYQNETYGNNPRLAELNKAMGEKIVSFTSDENIGVGISENDVRRASRKPDTVRSLVKADIITDRVATFFNMNLQERTTFKGV